MPFSLHHPEYDLKNGDIVIEDGDTTLFIDVKVASDKSNGSGKTSVGPISLSSVLKFANEENHIYLCMNCDGSKALTIDGKKLYSEFMKDPVLFASRGRKPSGFIKIGRVAPADAEKALIPPQPCELPLGVAARFALYKLYGLIPCYLAAQEGCRLLVADGLHGGGVGG